MTNASKNDLSFFDSRRNARLRQQTGLATFYTGNIQNAPTSSADEVMMPLFSVFIERFPRSNIGHHQDVMRRQVPYNLENRAPRQGSTLLLQVAADIIGRAMTTQSLQDLENLNSAVGDLQASAA